MTERQYKNAIDREVSKWPRANVVYKPTRRHVLAVVSFGGRTDTILFAKTASDWRGLPNTISKVRQKLKSLGASPIRAANDN